MFPNSVPAWRFVDRSVTIPLTINFVDPTFIKESISLTNVVSNTTNVNFIGVKVGDVNNSLTPITFTGDATERGNTNYDLYTNDKEFVGNEDVFVNIHGLDYSNINALQGTFDFDVNKLELKDIKFSNVNGLNKESFNLQMTNNGKLPMVWFDVNGLQIANEENFVTLVFKAKNAGRLSESLEINASVTNALATTSDNQFKSLNLQFTNGVGADFALNQNTPNPFDNTTKISFSLPTESDATVKIVDVNGN